ncbi:crossover junction endodeoxyribonuclease RuvC [Emcibacter nanhaiensis]|uniref:Crossover junction endodeoxyribonuclease RuvC n=1 Tax=Emcibacter nanhaiensis TaxID=1505037 RepID=A0A501PPK4_9PROT|nr:crossover junction endodeoxyribonuclease RuvC [Emcibacter nanhaiensis]
MIGLDPGLRKTGWGIIEVEGSRLIHVANGIVHSDASCSLAERLVQLYDGLTSVIADWEPHSAAVEETFVNKNPTSTLKLGQARGVVLLVPAMAGIPVAEYTPNHIKKSVVGSGHAAKEQVHAMIGVLLPGVKVNGEDAGDALSVAICHAHNGGGHRSLHSTMSKKKNPLEEALNAPPGAQIIVPGRRQR